MKKSNPVWYVVIALTIWCTWNSAKSSNSFAVLSRLDTEVSIMTREVGFLMDRSQAIEEIDISNVIKEVEIPDVVKAVTE